MIVKAIICERMKCRGTLIWPAFLLIPVIPILLGVVGSYLAAAIGGIVDFTPVVEAPWVGLPVL